MNENNPITTDLGAVTAYAAAVEKGYTGTRDDFGQLLANFAGSAQQVADDREAVKEMKNAVDQAANSFEIHVEEKKTEASESISAAANTAKEESIAAIQEASTSGVKSVQDKTSEGVNALETASQTGVSNITTAVEEGKKNFVTDDTLEIPGRAADAKVTGDKIGALKEDLDTERKRIDVLNDGGLNLKDEVIDTSIKQWLTDHPEATTTVQDGALNVGKFSDALKKRDFINVSDYADNTGKADCSDIVQGLIDKNPGKLLFFPFGVYLFKKTIVIKNDINILGCTYFWDTSNKCTILKYDGDANTSFIVVNGVSGNHIKIGVSNITLHSDAYSISINNSATEYSSMYTEKISKEAVNGIDCGLLSLGSSFNNVYAHGFSGIGLNLGRTATVSQCGASFCKYGFELGQDTQADCIQTQFCGNGILIEDGDGLFADNVQIYESLYYGCVVSRLSVGRLDVNIDQCGYSGIYFYGDESHDFLITGLIRRTGQLYAGTDISTLSVDEAKKASAIYVYSQLRNFKIDINFNFFEASENIKLVSPSCFIYKRSNLSNGYIKISGALYSDKIIILRNTDEKKDCFKLVDNQDEYTFDYVSYECVFKNGVSKMILPDILNDNVTIIRGGYYINLYMKQLYMDFEISLQKDLFSTDILGFFLAPTEAINVPKFIDGADFSVNDDCKVKLNKHLSGTFKANKKYKIIGRYFFES